MSNRDAVVLVTSRRRLCSVYRTVFAPREPRPALSPLRVSSIKWLERWHNWLDSLVSGYVGLDTLPPRSLSSKRSATLPSSQKVD